MNMGRVAIEIAKELTEKDLMFSVETAGRVWETFRFRRAGKTGVIAFWIEGKTMTVGVMQYGQLTKRQVVTAIRAAHTPKGKERGKFVNGYVRNGVKIAGYYRS